jgi:threonine dehydrogenase-like Zn-dependent dehydrogenase
MPCRPPEPRAAIRPESTKLRLALRSGHASATDAKSSFEERNVHEAHGEDIEEVGHAVQEFRRGDRVITMMQGLGGVRAERPGRRSKACTGSPRFQGGGSW